MKRDSDIVSYNMSRIRSKDTRIELLMRRALWARGLRYRKNYTRAAGTPDIAFPGAKVAVFCDSSFWHGRDWAVREQQIHVNRSYWLPKIERNIARDVRVNETLEAEGWLVLRYWDDCIEQRVETCADEVEAAVRQRTRLRQMRPVV
ncbi:MAG: very short patch repair endonuclease [Actinomycetota bacterium]|nr:very short patch repair endonuclease [Actinomycetota bacterium]